MAKRYYKIEVEGHGGEYAMGFINEEDEVNLLRELAEDGEVGWFNDSDDGEVSVQGYEQEDVFHAFGGEVNDVKLNIDEIEKPTYDKYGTPDIYTAEEINRVGFWMSREGSTAFCARNPYVYKYDEVKKRHDLNENALVYAGYSFEKGGWNDYLVETEGEFDMKNLVFGVCSMDECLDSSEIIDNIYYITPEQFKKHLEDKGNDETLSEEIREVYKSNLTHYIEALEGESAEYAHGDYINEIAQELKEVSNFVNDETNPYDGEMYDPYPEFKLEQLGDAEGHGKGAGAVLLDMEGNELQELVY